MVTFNKTDLLINFRFPVQMRLLVFRSVIKRFMADIVPLTFELKNFFLEFVFSCE